MSYSDKDEVKRLLSGIANPRRPQRALYLDEYYKLFPVSEGMRRSHEDLINEQSETKRRRLRELEARKWGLLADDGGPDGGGQKSI